MSFIDYAGNGKFFNVNVSYTVVGYHPNTGTDPLYAPLVDDQTKYGRLDVLGLAPKNDITRRDIDGGTTMRTFCHGSIYNLYWERALPDINDSNMYPRSWQREISYPADEVQTEFLQSHPVSIGTNALDALFGWLKTIPDDVNTGLPPQDVVPAELIKKNLLKLQTLLLDLNDNLDAQLQAEDLLAMNNFVPSSQGTQYHLQTQNDDTKNTMPSNDAIQKLRALNEYQTRMNALLRQEKRLKGDLFNVWWTYTCDRKKGDDTTQSARKLAAAQAAKDLKQAIANNKQAVSTTKGWIENIKSNPALNNELKEGAEIPFYLQRDPTLFVAGLRNAWPANTDNADNKLPIRTISNTKQTTGAHQPTSVTEWRSHNQLTPQLPDDVVASTEGVFAESSVNWTDNMSTVDHDLYYKNGDRYSGKNGWFPLFIEWEAEFYNIPFENWEFSEAAASGVVGYHVKDAADVTSGAIKGDLRKVSGRCPIMPQASSILATTLQQAFDRIGAANLPITLDQQNDVTKSARELDTVSTPLAGFTNQLITQMQGTHVTPVIYDQGGRAQFIDDGAAQISDELFLEASDLAIDGTEIDTTPFASIVPIPADAGTYTPFKPLTHGQFRFTKFNVIDKFGQIVRGIRDTCDPLNSIGPTRLPLFPCLGAAYSVDTVSQGGTDRAKTVIPRQDQLCEFVQLPPSINQNARINADFVVDFFTGSMMQATALRAASDWDNPVRGWLVLNYANASMQVCLAAKSFLEILHCTPFLEKLQEPTNDPLAGVRQGWGVHRRIPSTDRHTGLQAISHRTVRHQH